MFIYFYILYFIFFFYFYFLFCIIFCIFCVRFYISFLEFVLYSVYDFIINKWHWVTLKSGTRGVKIFWRISVIMLVWFDLERPDLVRQHMYGMSVSQPRPVPRDRPYRAPASPFGTSYMRTHSMKQQPLHRDRTRCEENFYRVDHARSVSGANLLICYYTFKKESI